MVNPMRTGLKLKRAGWMFILYGWNYEHENRVFEYPEESEENSYSNRLLLNNGSLFKWSLIDAYVSQHCTAYFQLR